MFKQIDFKKGEMIIKMQTFDNGMKNLDDLGLISVLNDKVIKEKIPVLGSIPTS